ncbi:NUDIX hydrolase [Natronococcus wangiae]|uniref:NUDIX hydrolase n=1 Tax=Natronococcus wangiae TaxID=3068275 RepID=UPI00273E6D16|nr:NUDIX hydrolase [Natronococcus sp. AD5]
MEVVLVPSDMDPERLRVLATDGVVLVDGQVVLIQRDHEPYAGQWVLPGGLVERGETARTACEREIAEEIGLTVVAEQFVGLYDEPGRDPRGNVSAAFRCAAVNDEDPQPLEEARAVEVFDSDNLPSMGFDHERIVADTLELKSE